MRGLRCGVPAEAGRLLCLLFLRVRALPACAVGRWVLFMILTATQTINDRIRHLPTWPVYAIGTIVPFWYLYLGLTGGLGPEPVEGAKAFYFKAGGDLLK